MILELPNKETLEDGRIKITDSFEECIEALKKCTSTVKFDFSGVDEATMKMSLNSRGYKMSFLNSISYDNLKNLYNYCESHMI